MITGKQILIVWSLAVFFLTFAIIYEHKEAKVNTIPNKKRVKQIKDTCNACAIHRIYGLKNATPHYK